MHLTPANGLLNGLALSPDGSTAYVADAENNLLLVANTPTQTQLASIPVGVSPSTVVVTPGGSEVWVATLAGLDIVNATTSQLSGSVKLSGTPFCNRIRTLNYGLSENTVPNFPVLLRRSSSCRRVFHPLR